MADPTLVSHASTYTRWTLTQIRDYVMLAAGGAWDDLNATEQGTVDLLINARHDAWRHLARNAKRWAEDSVTITWVSGDDSQALPANVGEVVGRHIWALNDDGDPSTVIEIVREEEWTDSMPTDGSTQVARLYREEASTQKRVLWIHPRPDAGDQFKLVFLSHASLLSDGADILEAPAQFNLLVGIDSAIEWLKLRGDREAAALLVGDRDRHLQELTGARETDRPARARFYDEVGFEGSRQGAPAVRQTLLAVS